MRIIINADDFGFSDDTVDATINCFLQSSITSASIMANMPATSRALEFARKHPEYSYGVHLTFTSDGPERPLLDSAEVPGLVDLGGRFLPINGVRIKALLRRLPEDQIAREMTAQLAFVTDHGVRISHVDSHGHIHKFASFRKVLRSVLPRFGITRVRNVQNIYLRKLLRSPTYWLGSIWRRSLLAHFESTDHFYMATTAGDRMWWETVLDEVRDGSLEVGVHPGIHEAWRAEESEAAGRFADHARAVDTNSSTGESCNASDDLRSEKIVVALCRPDSPSCRFAQIPPKDRALLRRSELHVQH